MFGNMFGDVQASTSLNLGENLQVESTTMDATPSSALVIAVPESQAVHVEARVTARCGDTKHASWRLSGLFYRNAGGVVTAEGDVVIVDSHVSDGCAFTAELYVDTTNNQVHVLVTGGAGETVFWLAQATYFRK